jgi:hypothetical protein
VAGLASSFLPQAISVAATVAAKAKRPNVRFVIMGVSPLLGVGPARKRFFLTANGLETKNQTK